MVLLKAHSKKGKTLKKKLLLRSLFVLCITLLNIHLCVPVFSGNHVVNSKSSFDTALKTALPGDTILWKTGVYHDIYMVIGNSQLVVAAEIPGKVIFTGNSKVLISGNHNTLSGFQFLSGNIGSDEVIVVNGSYNHITQLNIKDYDCTKYLVISSAGEHNTVSYCNLEHRANSLNKNILSILVDANKPGYNTIRYCSFKNFDGNGGDEGVEPIRIGLGSQGGFISRSVVEYCYFTQCNGDGEIISNKSRQNVFRHNTFEDNPVAELVLRHGDEGVVYGNFFLNGMGGIRVKEGQHHVIYNNYFSGLKERSLILLNYHVDPLDSITIAYNTFVNSARVRLGSPGSYAPAHITLANNIFSEPDNTLFSEGTGTETWIGNIAYGSLGIFQTEGLRIANPGLELNSEGYCELQATSTAIDSAQPGYPDLPNYPELDIDYEVAYDLMKQQRPSEIPMKDIGCSEFPHEVVVKPHATAENTGPPYLQNADFLVLETAIVGGGSIILDPPGGIYDSGTEVLLTAAPSNYSTFLNWSGDLTGQSNPDTLIMDSNKKVFAHFDMPPLHRVNIFLIGPGYVEADPPGWYYPDSTKITLTAVPDSGNMFSHWSGQLSGTENPIDIMVTDYVEALANFADASVSTEEISVGFSRAGNFSLDLFPVPAENTLHYTFTSNRQCSAGFFIYGVSGSLVKKVSEGIMEPGKHRLEADISDLTAGAYAMRAHIFDPLNEQGTETYDQITKMFLKK